MHGHEGVIRMRQAGKKPAVVFINDFPCKTDWEDWGDHSTICTHGDRIHTLDLRFLVGIAVVVLSCELKRAKALFKACKRASCSVVSASHIDEHTHFNQQNGWTEVYRG